MVEDYSDKRRLELSFVVGDFVYLKISLIQGTRRFQVKGKLAPRYFLRYQVLQRIGAVAYCIQLPEKMSDMHDVFHVSQLKKCLEYQKNKYLQILLIYKII